MDYPSQFLLNIFHLEKYIIKKKNKNLKKKRKKKRKKKLKKYLWRK